MTNRLLATIVATFLVATISTLLFWNANNFNAVTGDEPHYLVMASGIAKHATLEQTIPYREEFRTNTLSPASPWAPRGAEPSEANTHAIAGPHGLYNVHDIGLPLLLAVPVLLGGTPGGKLAIVLCGALLVILVCRFASALIADDDVRFWSAFCCSVATPVVLAATQIFPELPAGMLAMAGLYWVYTIDRSRPRVLEWLLIGAVAFLPWLQVKFGVASAILLLAAAVKIYADSKDLKRIAAIFLIGGVSACALAAYNQYAFGNFTGPYEAYKTHLPHPLVFDAQALMAFFGLLFDQNQGFLMQSPIFLAGVFGLAPMYRFNRSFTIVWALVFLSLIVPNALHVLQYGAFSFSGRFGWAAMAVFLIPTLYGLQQIARIGKRPFYGLVSLSILFELYVLFEITFSKAYLYNKTMFVLPDNYSIFYFPVYRWLPMLYDKSWTFRHLPNDAWLVFFIAVFALGFVGAQAVGRWAPRVLAPIAALIFVAGLARAPAAATIFIPADQLPSLTGRLQGAARIAQPGVDSPGFVNVGPYLMPMRRGTFEVEVSYSSAGSEAQSAGTLEVWDTTTGDRPEVTNLPGTGGSDSESIAVFKLNNWNTHLIEFRNNWNGARPFKLYGIRLQEWPTRLSMAR